MLWQDGVEFSRLNPLGVALGSRTKEAYLDDALGWYSPAMRALQDLPEDSRVIFLWEERGLYAPPGTEADQLIDNWYVMRRTIGDADSIRSYWLSKGFTHVLVYQSGAEFEREHKQQFENSDWSSLDALLSSLAPQQSFGNVYELI